MISSVALLSPPCPLRSKTSAQNRQRNPDQHAEDGGQFSPAIRLAEKQEAAGERDQRAAAPQARHERDQGRRVAQGVEINIIGEQQRDREQRDAPTPVKL